MNGHKRRTLEHERGQHKHRGRFSAPFRSILNLVNSELELPRMRLTEDVHQCDSAT